MELNLLKKVDGPPSVHFGLPPFNLDLNRPRGSATVLDVLEFDVDRISDELSGLNG